MSSEEIAWYDPVTDELMTTITREFYYSSVYSVGDIAGNWVFLGAL